MISVIVPVYNTAQYLEGCIESILRQSYGDLEILAVDDGSTDDSPRILSMLAARDPRLRVIRQENAGVSAARNRGLAEARGEYITFVDSDDTLEPDLYELLLRLMQDCDAEIAHCSYNRIENGTVKHVGNSGKQYVQSREEALECFLGGRLYVASCWNKLYARHLLEDVRFREDLKMSEDLLVNIAAFSRAARSVFWDVCKYNYLISETSACRNTPSVKKSADHTAVARSIFAQFPDGELHKLARKGLLNALLSSYKAQVYEAKPDRAKQKQLCAEIRTLLEQGAVFTRKQWVDYTMMRWMPWIYKPLYRLYDTIRVPNLDV